MAYTASTKEGVGYGPVQKEAANNETAKESLGEIGTLSGYTGIAALAFKSTGVGAAATIVGGVTGAVSQTYETDPEKITLEYTKKYQQ